MTIVILNGASSTGKTSIIKELQKILLEPYLTTGLDSVIYMMPDSLNDYHGDLKPRSGFGWLEEKNDQGKSMYHLSPGEYGLQVYNMLKKQVKFLADEGFNVLVDHVALLDDDFNSWKTILKSHKLFFVGITAEVSILEKREIDRGDRKIGGSLAQQGKVHRNYIYDLLIDTSHIKPYEAA